MFRIVTGILVLLLGGWLCYLGVRTHMWVFFVYACITSGVAVAILLNTHEDDIEDITKK